MRTCIAALAATGLAAALLPGTATARTAGDRPELPSFRMDAKTSSAHRAGAAEQLVSASATFNTRVPGMPRPGSRPDQQVLPGARLDINYGYHWETGALTYHFEVRPISAGLRPDDQPSDYVGVGMGIASGTSCVLDEVAFDATSRFFPERLVYGSGDATDNPNAGLWNCAALFVDTQDGAVVHDAYVSALDVVTAAPQLTLRAPRKDRLVKGVWTSIPVRVANTGDLGARDVVVTARGKGVKVRRRLDLDSLRAGSKVEGSLWVKLTRAKGTLRLAVSELGQTMGRARVKLRRRPAPPAPRAGAWSGGGASFVVRSGKVRGFRITTRTTCGGYPDMPTTTTNTYDFPTVRIPRNNEVVASDKGNQGKSSAYSVHLDLTFVSRTKVKGKFSYYGPARCVAVQGFTAQVGR